MRKIKQNFALIIAFGLIFLGLVSNVAAQNERATRDVLNKLNIKFSEFDSNLNRAINQENFSREDEDEINGYLNNLDRQLENLNQNFQQKKLGNEDITALERVSEDVNQFLNRFRWNAMVQKSWSEFRALVEQLSSNYRTVPNNFPSDRNYPNDKTYWTGLTGTYRLDVNRSDDARRVVEDGIRGMSDFERQTALRHLEEKLNSPESVALSVKGKSVSIASSLAPEVRFEATGRERFERTADGKNIRVRTDLRDDELTISVEQEAQNGNRLRDYSYIVNFSAFDDGRYLRVVRRLTDDEISQTFVITSVYEKVSDIAQLDIYNNQNNFPTSGSSNNPVLSDGRRGEYYVPNGIILTGILENDISTKNSAEGEKFRMTIQAPREYRGAIVEGYVSGITRSGRVAGSSKLTFNFERIRLANGEVYDFAGFLQAITDTKGKNIKIDEEGTARGKSQTKETAKRGGIGAGAGAIIGAIIGGAKGAIIGATIGAGSGAGTVIVQGKDDLDIKAGSSITVQSSSPIR